MKILHILLVSCILFPLTFHCPAQAAPTNTIFVDDFEAVDDWYGLTLETSTIHNGTGAGRWENHIEQTSIRKNFESPLDASRMNFFECWLYSGKANNAEVMLVLNSQNEADPEGSDYYAYEIKVTWSGWSRLHIPLENFTIARNPLGWQEIQSVSLSASGWNNTPLPDTLLIFDNMYFSAGTIAQSRHTAAYDGSDFLYTYTLDLEERLGTERNLSFQAELPASYPFEITFQPTSLSLAANSTAQAQVHIRIPAAQITPITQLTMHQADIIVIENGNEVDMITLDAAIPLPISSHPRLLLDTADLTRINDWVASESWASSARSGIINSANNWPDSFTEKYYLTTWALPPEGGQWGMWYICPQGGANLVYEGPGRHICPLDDQVYSGWPYEQVIYGRMHSNLARAARDLGLAYQLSGETHYAQSAAEILLAYADAYLNYPYHDINDQMKLSGGRVTSQTLDESNWLIPVAWAYDLIADSGVLSEAQRSHIEQDLLYAAAITISRNPSGMSNWQSWHNAGLGAVGFSLQDPLLISQALDDPTNGFDYQMEASVSADGFWYEGSWGYHLYALQAHRYLAEMAAHSGIDLYANPALHNMFAAPLRFAMPDLSLPPFNDSGSANLIGYDYLYEVAYQRYGDDWLAIPLGQRNRGREALLWGAQTLPPPAAQESKSTLFPDAGYAVLRNNEGEFPLYLALDYGPHGGWHGHYDKLGFVSYGRDSLLGLDPGTQSYAAPAHETWDKVTIAHNTIIVDGQVQKAASGSLHQYVSLSGLSAASADAGEAYTSTQLLRTLAVSGDYILDHYNAWANDNQLHTLDWIYHNPGVLTTTLPLAAYSGLPTSNGYQHLSNPQAVTTDADWQVNFLMNEDPNQPYGSVWADPDEIIATFSYSNEQAASGSGSGRLSYDFSPASGYILYSTPSPDPIDEAPLGLQIAIYGDGSGNNISLRLYDSSDERFVTEIGEIDWHGWRTITITDLPSWTHFLGDDNGIFDPPVGRIGVQLTHQNDATPNGTLYIDDLYLLYADENQLVEDFEIPVRELGLWMLGQPNTTILTGENPNPDLDQSVPFVMARRTAQKTTFATLMTPSGATPVIEDFATLPTDAINTEDIAAYSITTTTYTDQLLIIPDGTPGTTHTFGNATCNGELCMVRRDNDENLLRLILVNGSQLQDGEISLLHSADILGGVQIDYDGNNLQVENAGVFRQPVYIWAPEATNVLVNNVPANFTREGDYIVLAAEQLIWLPLVLR